jgi:hypothetical protein
MSLTELALPEIGGLALQEGFNGLVIVIVIVNEHKFVLSLAR